MVYVKLKEKKERGRNQAAIQRDVRTRLLAVPGIVASVNEVGRMTGEKPLMVDIRGEDISLLKKYAARLKGEMYRIPGIVDLEVTLEHDIPEYRLIVDRERATDLGVNTGTVSRTVGALVGGQVVTTYEDEDGDSVDVRVRLPGALRVEPSQVALLRVAVPSARGGAGLVPLSEVLKYRLSTTPSEIDRQDLTRKVVISANLDGLPLGEAMKKVREASSRLDMAPGYNVIFSGEGDTMAESFGYMAEALLLAVIFVYLILAAQFESFIDPLAIMLSLPLSIVGMAGMLFLTGDTINIMSLIGLILLMGLVTKNAILLVDYAKILRRGGMERTEAVIAAGRTRLRPIMMTTLAMIFGMLPLALALGAGAEMRAPMARAVIGGLITSTLLTLLVVPVVYTLFDDFGDWARRKWEGKRGVAAAGLLMALCAGAAAFAPPAASAGEAAGPETFTLDEALRAALESNRQIRAAVEQRNRATGRYVEERAAALPQLAGTAGAQRSSDGSMAILPGAEISDRRVADLELSQPLYAGGAVSAGIRAAKFGLASAGDRIRSARHNALREVHAAFHNVLLARELSRIALQNRDQKARHLEEARKKYLAGTATDYDVLVAEVGLQNAQPEVLHTENLIRTSRERLRFLIGKGDREVDARGDLSVSVGEFPDHEKSLSVALANRPELSDLRHRRALASELVTVAKSGYLPRLNFQGAVGYQDLDFNVFDFEGKTWSVGVFAYWSLFDGFRTRGQVAQARSEEADLRIEEARLLDAVALEVRDAVNAVRESGETVTALAGTAGQAERLVSMAEKGFEYGVKTRLEVDDAQLNLSQATGNLARARRDYLVAKFGLLRAMGTMEDVLPGVKEPPPPFVPAGSPLGLVGEVLGGKPDLPPR